METLGLPINDLGMTILSSMSVLTSETGWEIEGRQSVCGAWVRGRSPKRKDKKWGHEKVNAVKVIIALVASIVAGGAYAWVTSRWSDIIPIYPLIVAGCLYLFTIWIFKKKAPPSCSVFC